MNSNKKITAGSINVENGATWYIVKYADGTEERFYPYIEPVPNNVLKFFKSMSIRHNNLLLKIYGSKK